MSSVTQSVSQSAAAAAAAAACIARPCACVAPNDNNYIFYAWRARARPTDRPPARFTHQTHAHNDATVYIYY
jgi:hypothetical protein